MVEIKVTKDCDQNKYRYIRMWTSWCSKCTST